MKGFSTGTGTKHEEPSDEESLYWQFGLGRDRRPKQFSAPMRRKTAVFLLVVDLIIIGLLIQAFEPLITLLYWNKELFGPQDALSSLNISDPLQQTSRSNQIPRILHQVALSDLDTSDPAREVIRDDWAQSQKICMDVYSDFEYKLWTNEAARDFLSLEYPWFLETWDSYPFLIQRADAIRYFFLYHYGGLYVDMDTSCNQPIPLPTLQSEASVHRTILKSGTQTGTGVGIANDILITSAKHPLYAATITKLPLAYAMQQSGPLIRLWARLQPYGAIMFSTGPLFLTLVVKDYLLAQPSLPSPTVGTIDPVELARYFTHLHHGTWHRADTGLVMWIADKPWIWFGTGAVVVFIGLSIFNWMLMGIFRLRPWRVATHGWKLAKVI